VGLAVKFTTSGGSRRTGAAVKVTAREGRRDGIPGGLKVWAGVPLSVIVSTAVQFPTA